MTQEEVFRFLNQHKNRWYTTRQICEAINKQGIDVSLGSITRNAFCMRTREEIKYKVKKHNTYYYKWK